MRRHVAGLLAAVAVTSPAPAADGPTILVEVGRAVAAAAVAETRDRPETVNDLIGGARVTGSGTSHAEVGVEFVPCDYRAVLDVVLVGTARTRTVGVNGVVHVNTNAVTQFAGRKRVWTDGERVEASPATVRVRQDTELTGVSTPFAGAVGRLVGRVAARTFYREQDETNKEAAQLTERQVTEEFDRDATLALAAGERVFREAKAELRRRGLWPQDLRLSTTAEDLRLRGRLGKSQAPNPKSQIPTSKSQGFDLAVGTCDLGSAVSAPPAIVGRPDLAVRVHASVFTTAAASHYGGRTVPGEELDRDFTAVLGPQTAGGRLDPQDREQFAVTFAPVPLEAAFAGRQVRAVVHTRGFTADDRQITDPFDIRVAYDLARTPAGLVLTRRELEVLPADVAAGKRRMSLRENSLAKLLSKRFDKLLPAKQEVVLADLPGGLRKLGRLVPTQADADGGWLALAWRRAP